MGRYNGFQNSYNLSGRVITRIESTVSWEEEDAESAHKSK